MISAEARSDFTELAARLTARARNLALAQLEEAELFQRSDPARWRKPGLLWPLFTKG